jgi:hypothetical protein
VFADGRHENVFSQGGITAGWHHVVLKRNSSPIVLWVDGAKFTAPPAAAGTPATFEADFLVGGKTPSTNLLPDGARVAEVALYDYDFTDAQIAEHFAAGKR